jgi:hypothetical protein
MLIWIVARLNKGLPQATVAVLWSRYINAILPRKPQALLHHDMTAKLHHAVTADMHYLADCLTCLPAYARLGGCHGPRAAVLALASDGYPQ